jgi:sulfur carrier protein
MSASSSTAALTVIVNDEPRTLSGDGTVASLAGELGLADRKGIAIAINGAVIPRASWPTHALAAGDRVLVIRATQGG